MTILALLIGLAASHFLPDVRRIRDYRWLQAPVQTAGRLGDAAWLPMVAVIAVTIVTAILVTGILDLLAGNFGVLLASIAAVMYCLGPRDLADDLEQAADDDDNDRRRLAREQLHLHSGDGARQAAAATLHAALARWFGILFWFALLGVAGALLYRLTRVLARDTDLGDEQRAWMDRLLTVLNAPVVLFMLLAIALMTDFDRVLDVWRERAEPWLPDASLLDAVSEALCPDHPGPAAGLESGARLVWRMLGLWLVVLSILLLAGWLA